MVVIPSTTVYSITVPMMKGTGLDIDDLITGLGVSVCGPQSYMHILVCICTGTSTDMSS
jgi:hypothetical protein